MAKIDGYPIRAAALWWCRKEDYAALLAIFEDADRLPPTWEQWLKLSEEGERGFQAQGLTVERIYLDPVEFSDWCKSHNRRIDSDSRIGFAGWVAGNKHKTTH